MAQEDAPSIDAFDEPLLDFSDLQRRKIANNHTQLQNLIRDHGFPKGFWTSPNAHRWTPRSVREWLASRTTGPSPHVQARATKSAAVRRDRRHLAREASTVRGARSGSAAAHRGAR